MAHKVTADSDMDVVRPLRFAPNATLPPPASFRLCVSCRHFVRDRELHGPAQTQQGRCELFGELELVTGHVTYDLASECRMREDRCGHAGKHYVASPQFGR